MWQVGDGIMVYLLKNASIFLPIADKKYQQLTGPPISNLCRKTFKCTPNTQCQSSSLAPCGNAFYDLDKNVILKRLCFVLR